MARIRIQDVCKSYDGKPVLRNISMEVEEGSLTVLLGPSGSGKTTLLHGIAGVVPMDQGSIHFDDECIDRVPIEKRNAVLVDQNLLLFPHMTVSQNIGFGLKMRGMKRPLIQQKVEELVRLLELQGHEQKRPGELSGGQMQRVAIARALAIEPRVLLLDEPFSKLDITLRKNMQTFVRALQKKLGTTMVMVTHDKEEALSMADKVAVLLDGAIKQYDAPDRVYEKPESREVSDFFGVRNYLEGQVRHGRFLTALGAFRVEREDTAQLTYVFRPEEVRLGGEEEESVQGVIRNRTYSGDKVSYIIEAKGLLIHQACSVNRHYDVGDPVFLHFDFKHAACFLED